MQPLLVFSIAVAIVVGITALAQLQKRPRRSTRRRRAAAGSDGGFVPSSPSFGANDTRDGHFGSGGGWSDGGDSASDGGGGGDGGGGD